MGLVEDAQALRAKIDAGARAARVTVADKLLADELADSDIVAVTPLFDPWTTDTAYDIGDIVVHDSDPYKVVQAHKSQADWTPDKTPALWTSARKTAGQAPDEWKQPTGAQDAYRKGDRVTFQGAVWESVIDANVWSPTAYPAGWKQV